MAATQSSAAATVGAIFRSMIDRACTPHIIPHVVLGPIVDLFYPSLATLAFSHALLWSIFFIIQSTQATRLANDATAEGYFLNSGDGDSTINTQRVMYASFIIYWCIRAVLTYTIRMTLCKPQFQLDALKRASTTQSSKYLESLLAAMNPRSR